MHNPLSAYPLPTHLTHFLHPRMLCAGLRHPAHCRTATCGRKRSGTFRSPPPVSSHLAVVSHLPLKQIVLHRASSPGRYCARYCAGLLEVVAGNSVDKCVVCTVYGYVGDSVATGVLIRELLSAIQCRMTLIDAHRPASTGGWERPPHRSGTAATHSPRPTIGLWVVLGIGPRQAYG